MASKKQRKLHYIFIDDEPESISKKIKSINTKTKDKEIDFELIYEYFKIFGYSDSDIDVLQDDFTNNKTTSLNIKNQLSEEINNYLIPIKKRKEEILQERELIINRINLDTQYVKQIVSNNIDYIFQNCYNNEFYKSFKI